MRVDVYPVHNGYEVAFDYHPSLVNGVKMIPGARFNSGKKTWWVPQSSESVLLNWAKLFQPKSLHQPVIEIGEIEPLPELTVDIPLLRQMFPYQRNGVAYALDKKRVIVGDEPGLGKSAMSIAFTEGAKSKCILVICPATLRENWKREFKIWTGKEAIVLSDRLKSSWHHYYKAGMGNIFITNYESLKKYFVEAVETPKGKPLRLNHIKFKETINLFDTVIVDEVHRCKDGRTQTAKYVMGICKGKENVLALTGTPVVNKPIDLIPQLYIIQQLDKFGGYKAFIDRYCAGGRGYSNLNELNYLMHKHCFYRREKKEVLKDLPDKMRNIVRIDITNRAEYEKAEENLIDYLRENLKKTEGQINSALRGRAMVLIGILKQISARGKVQSLIEHIQEVVDAGEKIVVFAWHKEMVRELQANIQGSLTIVGDNTMEERQRAVDEFQTNPEAQVIICNIKSGGVGITLTASSRVAFLELPWHPADCDQCEDRCIIEGELILTPNGWAKIESLKKGDSVINRYGNPAIITDAWSKGNTKLVTEIKIEGFGITKTTNDHKYLTSTGEWIEASKLMPGYKIQMPFDESVNKTPDLINYPFDNNCRVDNYFTGKYGQKITNGRLIKAPENIDITEDFLFLCGYYAGDGFASTVKGKGRFVSVAGNIKNKWASIERCKKWFTNNGLSINTRLEEVGCEIRAYSAEWAYWFKNNFGEDAHSKKLPEFLLSLNKKQSNILLNGLMCSDGYYRNGRYEFITASNQLASQVFRIILRSGYRPTVNHNTTGQFIVSYSKSQIEPYALVQSVYTYFPKKQNGTRQKVYDITTDATESFILGSSVVHNCHRIGQKDSVQCTYFLGHDTIDEHIYDIINKKREIVNQVTGAADNIETNVIDEFINLFSSKFKK